MTRPFDHFVVFAEMRTGSNFLEASLNEFDGITCHGELFNPHFIGQKDRTEYLGVTMTGREADPLQLLDRLRGGADLQGFRFFHDHDPRVLARVLPDTRCAKIVLTRNPVESYISRKIAALTGQWKLTDVKHQKAARIHFDAAEFEAHVQELQAFQITLQRGLQTTGQTAFYIAYEDLGDVEVLNGLAAYLGVPARIEAPSAKLKKQNPAPIEEKVVNADELETAIARLDRFNLTRTPAFEPRRGPMVPRFIAAAESALLFMPVPGGPTETVADWLAALDGVHRAALQTGFTQKTLRRWKRSRPGHRSFTVLRHPLARAHAVFCDSVLMSEAEAVRGHLKRIHGVELPPPGRFEGWSAEAHRAAFGAFLAFLKAVLSGQTGLRVAPEWASQSAVLKGFAQFALPDAVLREDELQAGLATLPAGDAATPRIATAPTDAPHPLAEIADDGLEAAAREAYPRDFMEFGFDRWRG